jgi:hypothetical protein
MKYIVFLDGSAIIFSKTTSHKWMAGDKIVRSAGFCTVETYRNQYDDIRAKVQVYGKSDTLGVESNPADAKILEEMFI